MARQTFRHSQNLTPNETVRSKLARAYFLGVWITVISFMAFQTWSRIVEVKTPSMMRDSIGERRLLNDAITTLHSGDASHTSSGVGRSVHSHQQKETSSS